MKRNRPGSQLVRSAPATAQRVTVVRRPEAIQVNLDMRNAGQPVDGIIADYVGVLSEAESFHLMFAKGHPLTNAAVLLVEVIIPRKMFVDVLWPTMEDDFLKGLKTHVEQKFPKWQAKKLEKLDQAEYHCRRASVASISYTEDEAAIDFHLVSTHDLSAVVRGLTDDLNIGAVLRVLLSTPLLLKLILECETAVRGGGAP